MAVRIEGILIPAEKRIEASLQYIFGIGLTMAKKVLSESGVSPDRRVKDLDGTEVASLQKAISSCCVVEGDRRRDVLLSIKRLTEIKSYRGVRHKKALPVRGQRTKTNARTRKGAKRTKSVKSSKGK